MTGLATAGVIALYQISNLLFMYHYFSYDYYIAGVAVAALGSGFILASRYHKNGIMIDARKVESLTAKELRVLELIVQGQSNKEIAALNYIG